jgi:hypothetical protein
VLASCHHTIAARESSLTIDLSAVNFILVESIAPLIAEIAGREAAGLQTLLRLPRSGDVRQALRAWDFAATLKRVTKRPFVEFVDRRDHRYFRGFGGDRGSTADSYGLEVHDQAGSEFVLVPRVWRNMPLRYWNVRDLFVEGDLPRFQSAVRDETSRWKQDAGVSAVLEHHLGPFFGYVWSHIVHEAMSNAFRHGSANSVVAAAKADWSDKSQRDTHFMLAFWDDGVAMYETLRRASTLDRITAPGYELSGNVAYDVKHVKERESVQRSKKTSRELPTGSSSDEDFFLATLFPGVTADPDGRSHAPHPDVASNNPSAALAGMGLANLVNAAVDVLKGSVAFRSGSLFMNIRGAKRSRAAPRTIAPAGVYSAKIERRWPIFGNVVTVRLPLRS